MQDNVYILTKERLERALDIKEVLGILQNSIEGITDTNRLKSILFMGDNLFRYDSINRMLIRSQCDNILDIHTLDEWELLGRTVTKNAQSIYTLVPQYKSEYVSGEDNCSTVDISDLSQSEKMRALEIGIIIRKDSIEKLQVHTVYDIRDTKQVDRTTEFKASKPKLSSERLLKIFAKLTFGNIVACDEFYYSDSDNTLYISKDKYENLAYMVSKALSKFYSKCYDVTDKQYIQYMVYSITTLFRGNTTRIRIDVPKDLDSCIQIFSIIDDIIEKIISEFEFENSENMILNAEESVNRLKKAKVILDIIDANSINKKLVCTG